MINKKFDSLFDFSDHLMKAATAEIEGINEGLHLASEIIKKDAQSQIGHLQPTVGPFNAWKELAPSTKLDKERKGYVFNSDYNPLFRTGELRSSIDYEVDISKLESTIGSKDPIAAYQEFGTKYIPPRPFIGPAMFKNMKVIAEIFGEITVQSIAYGKIVPENIARSVGYHQDIKL